MEVDIRFYGVSGWDSKDFDYGRDSSIHPNMVGEFGDYVGYGCPQVSVMVLQFGVEDAKK